MKAQAARYSLNRKFFIGNHREMARGRTKFVRHLLKGLGYDLRRLQKFKTLGIDATTDFGREPGFDAFEDILPRPVQKLDILYRTCARVEVFGGQHKRFIGVPKSELLLRCLNSLLRSIKRARDAAIEVPISLTVFDDHSDPECVDAIKELLTKADCSTEFIALPSTGNGPSLEQTYLHAREHAEDLIYFAEDDYLHDDQAIVEILLSYERLAAVAEKDVVLFPTDYPDRYRTVEPAYVLLGSHRHWRSVGQTTGTLITSRQVFLDNWERFFKLTKYGIDSEITEATTINPIYETVPCFCPLPSLTVHMELLDTIAPLCDWRSWWEKSAL